MEIIAMCGNRCDLCAAYTGNIATYGAETVREKWRKYLMFEPPEEIECVGCHAEGYHPSAACAVRKCCSEKGYENCAACSVSICDFLKTNIEAMEAIVKSIADMPKEDYEVYILPYLNEKYLQKKKE